MKPKQTSMAGREAEVNDAGLDSSVEDFSPPPSPIASDTESDSDEQVLVEDGEDSNHEYFPVRGVRPYLFEPLAPATADDGGEAAAAEPNPLEHVDVSIW